MLSPKKRRNRHLRRRTKKGRRFRSSPLKAPAAGRLRPWDLVNPAGECDVWGKPSVATTTSAWAEKTSSRCWSRKTCWAGSSSAFPAERLGLGTLPYDINRTIATDPQDLPVNNSDVWLYNFNARFLAVKENAGDTPMAAGHHPGRRSEVQRRHAQHQQRIEGCIDRKSATTTTPAWTSR